MNMIQGRLRTRSLHLQLSAAVSCEIFGTCRDSLLFGLKSISGAKMEVVIWALWRPVQCQTKLGEPVLPGLVDRHGRTVWVMYWLNNRANSYTRGNRFLLGCKIFLVLRKEDLGSLPRTSQQFLPHLLHLPPLLFLSPAFSQLIITCGPNNIRQGGFH